MEESLEYALLLKRIQIPNNSIDIFVPIHLIKGTNLDDDENGPNIFVDTLGKEYNYYDDFDNVYECNEYCVKTLLKEDELKAKYSKQALENAEMELYEKYSNIIYIAYYDMDIYDMDIIELDLDKLYNDKFNVDSEDQDLIQNGIDLEHLNLNDIKAKKEDNQQYIAFEVDTIKNLMEYDSDNFKNVFKLISGKLVQQNSIDNNFKIKLNSKSLFETLINKTSRGELKINFESDGIIRYKEKGLIISLAEISKSIEVLYKKLLDLEYNNQKDSLEYEKNIEYLNLSIDAEQEILNELKLDYKRSLVILKYIIDNYYVNDYHNNEIDIYLNNDKKDLWKNRLLSHFKDYIFAYNINNIDKKSLNLMTTIVGSELRKYTAKEVIECLGINKFYEIMIINDFLRNIDKSQDKDLLSMKYLYSFLNKDIELDLLINKFDISDKTSLDEICVYNNPKLMNNIKNNIASNIVTREIFKILSIDDSEYNSDESKKYISLIQKYIDVCMNLMDKDNLKFLQNNMDNIITNNIDKNTKVKTNYNSRHIVKKVLTKNR